MAWGGVTDGDQLSAGLAFDHVRHAGVRDWCTPRSLEFRGSPGVMSLDRADGMCVGHYEEKGRDQMPKSPENSPHEQKGEQKPRDDKKADLARKLGQAAVKGTQTKK